MTTVTLIPNETIVLEMPDGRTAHLWYHTCDTCTSLDVWTTRGNEVEEISKNTGRTETAPVGVFGWRNGSRSVFPTDSVPGSHGWPAVGTVTVIWNDHDK
jgi:hypothetical protein